MNTEPIYLLAELLAHRHGEKDPHGLDAVRVIVSLIRPEVLAAIAKKTDLDPGVVLGHLVAMAKMCTAPADACAHLQRRIARFGDIHRESRGTGGEPSYDARDFQRELTEVLGILGMTRKGGDE